MKFWIKKFKAKATPDRQKSAYTLLIAVLGGLVLFLQWRWLGENRHLFAPFAIERIECEVCGKTGQIPKPGANNELEMCPACYGVGYHTIRRFNEAEVLCPACLGMGRLEDEDGAWRTCRRCDGRGLIEAGKEEGEEHTTSNVQHRTSSVER